MKNDPIKIADKLNDDNPLKIIMYRLENKQKNGVLYKSFCIICMVYIVAVQILAFLRYSPYKYAMLPMTLYVVFVAYKCWNNIYNKNLNVNESVTGTGLYIKTSSTFSLIYSIIVLITLLILGNNFHNGTNNNFISDMLLMGNTFSGSLYINYSIISGVISLLLVQSTDISSTYERIAINTKYNKFHKSTLIIGMFILCYVFYILCPLIYKDIFIVNNSLISVLLLLFICSFSTLIFSLMFFLFFSFLRKISLTINLIYKNLDKTEFL